MNTNNNELINTIEKLASHADYSFINTLNIAPNIDEDGQNYFPKEIFSGHYVPVRPTPIKNPIYIAHSKTFFEELGLDDSLAQEKDFIKMFSGDTKHLQKPLNQIGWATGYALSIYGTEYYTQCPFQTGNSYGDGRAISILEAVLNNKRWEMQLKGGGKTTYCRGADGRAVLRSSVREFLAQEHMHALGIPTSRSLTLYTSQEETVQRPWFSYGSHSHNPDIMIEESVAITTRVAPSFLRVGQLELFGRRSRKNEHEKAKEELEQIILHAIEREYADEIDVNLDKEEKIILFAQKFSQRLTSLVVNWIRVGFCQGNFNSDNTSVGGFTLDYGPFGFIDDFDSKYQPWTGGGMHFSFFNQGEAARKNFVIFCSALMPLLQSEEAQKKLVDIRNDFANIFHEKIESMWASKLGLNTFDKELFDELISLMSESFVDYTIFFRELSNLPQSMAELSYAFYKELSEEKLQKRWENWINNWKSKVTATSKELKAINPKYTLREWILVEAYVSANEGDYFLVHELQEVMTKPYEEQSKEIEEKYYAKKPMKFFDMAGISHISCSS